MIAEFVNSVESQMEFVVDPPKSSEVLVELSRSMEHPLELIVEFTNSVESQTKCVAESPNSFDFPLELSNSLEFPLELIMIPDFEFR